MSAQEVERGSVDLMGKGRRNEQDTRNKYPRGVSAVLCQVSVLTARCPGCTRAGDTKELLTTKIGVLKELQLKVSSPIMSFTTPKH